MKMTNQGLLLLFPFTLSNFLKQTCASTCQQIVPNTNSLSWPYDTFDIECDDFFDVCCDDGCCPRFKQTHIWLIVSCISFVFFQCLFGLWYCCFKNKLRNRPPQTDEEHVNSLLSRNVAPSNVYVTPPPSYGVSVTQNNPNAPPPSNQMANSPTAPPIYLTTTENRSNGAENNQGTNRNSTGFITPPPTYEEAVSKR